jgi:hypothetical protein
MTLGRYLHLSYQVLTGQLTASQIRNSTFLAMCSSHMMKMMSRRLHRKPAVGRNKAKATLVMFAALQHTLSLSEAVELYKNVYIILTSPTESESVKAAIAHVKESVNKKGVNERSILSDFESLDNEAVEQEVENDQSDELADECESAATNETNVSLKSQSPFTAAFKSTIAKIEVRSEISEANINPYYSPESLSVINDVIHLYPLWSACLQINELSFACDAQCSKQPKVSSSAVKCLTNGKVESYFKSVKYGAVEAGRNARHGTFIRAMLEFIQGKLAKIKLDSVDCKRKEKSQAELMSEKSKWSKRKKGKRLTYSEPSIAASVFDNVGRVKALSGKKSRSKQHSTTASQSENEQSSRVLIGTENGMNGVKEVSENDRSSLGNVLNTVQRQPQDLDTDNIDDVMRLLRRCYPEMGGLQLSVLGQNVRNGSVPKFQPEYEPFVQLMNVGDHWICATNVFSEDLHHVYVYDSSHQNRVAHQIKVQVSTRL